MNGYEKKYDDISITTEEEISKQFYQISDDMRGEASNVPILAKYLGIFSDGAKFFEQLHEKNSKLSASLKGMNDSVVANASKAQQIINNSESDAKVLLRLKSEFEDAMKKADVYKKSEAQHQMELRELRSTLLSINASANSDAFYQFQHLKVDIESLKKQILSLSDQSSDLTNQIAQSKYDVEIAKQEIVNFTDGEKSNMDEIRNVEAITEKSRSENAEMQVSIDNLSQEVAELEEKARKIDKSSQDVASCKQPHYHEISETSVILESYKEEAEIIHGRLRSKQKRLTELLEVQSQIQKLVDQRKMSLQEMDSQEAQIKLDLTKVSSENALITSSGNEWLTKQKNFSSEKAALRKKARDLRNTLLDLSFRLTKESNDTQTQSRVISSEKMAAASAKKDSLTAQHKLSEVITTQSNISAETTIVRAAMQRMREEASSLVDDIERKESERSTIESNCETFKQAAISLSLQATNSQSSLCDIQESCAHQSNLIDLLRQERDTFKRQYEIAKAEQTELSNNYDQLMLSIRSMTQMIDKVDVSISKAKDKAGGTKSIIQFLLNMKEKIEEGTHETELVTNRLTEEAIGLRSLISKSEHEKQRQEKDYQMLVNTHHVVDTQYLQKTRKLEQLKSQIQADEVYLGESAKAYIEKRNEIRRYEDECKALIQKESKLEKIAKEVEEKKNINSKILVNLLYERSKKAALVQEVATPKNVHRWQLISDPEYSMNIKYRMLLYSKLVQAHEKEIELKKQRDDLKQKVSEMRIGPEISIEEAKKYMEVYSADAKEKEAEVKRLRESVDGKRNDIDVAICRVRRIRGKVNERREATLLLKSMNDGAVFLTESGVEIPKLEFPVRPPSDHNANTARRSKKYEVTSARRPLLYIPSPRAQRRSIAL